MNSTIYNHQLDYWSPDNKNAAYPILLLDNAAEPNYRTSDKWVKDGSYLRMKNLVVGYTLPKNVINRLKCERVRFYLSGQNLFTLDNFYKGFDPEVSVGGGTYGGYFYPITRTFSFGVDISF